MKNREKYKNELRDVIKKDGRLCEFVKKHEVFRMFGKDSKKLLQNDLCYLWRGTRSLAGRRI